MRASGSIAYGGISAQAVWSRLIELKRKEVGAKGFSTRVVVIGEEAVLTKLARRDTPKLVALPEAFEAALLLFELDGSIDWFRIADSRGILEPTLAIVSTLHQAIMKQMKLAIAA